MPIAMHAKRALQTNDSKLTQNQPVVYYSFIYGWSIAGNTDHGSKISSGYLHMQYLQCEYFEDLQWDEALKL